MDCASSLFPLLVPCLLNYLLVLATVADLSFYCYHCILVKFVCDGRRLAVNKDQMPRCGLCEGIGGRAFTDKNEDIDLTPCRPVAKPEDLNASTVAPPLYPKKFTVRRKDGRQGLRVPPTQTDSQLPYQYESTEIL
eukprot:4811501-Amphidinium_carterae.1